MENKKKVHCRKCKYYYLPDYDYMSYCKHPEHTTPCYGGKEDNYSLTEDANPNGDCELYC